MRVAAALAAVALAGVAPLAAQGAAPAQAEPATADAPPADGEDILVTGMGGAGYRLTADQLRDAVRAFERHREDFAPEATLRWRIVQDEPVEGLEIRLVRGEERVAIAVDSAGEFTLPAQLVLTADWRLQTNAGRRQIRIRPLTFSPGSSDSDFRMGDARLLCRVFWAFANNQFSMFQRAMFGAVGGCGSRRVAIWYRSERPVATAATSSVNFDVRPDGSAWRPLLHDAAIADDARVRITYR